MKTKPNSKQTVKAFQSRIPILNEDLTLRLFNESAEACWYNRASPLGFVIINFQGKENLLKYF